MKNSSNLLKKISMKSNMTIKFIWAMIISLWVRL